MDAAAPAPPLSVVVPVYNEHENFPRFYDSLKANVRTEHEVLVVYDFEEDTTLPVVRELAKKDPSLLLVRNPARGVVSALRTGLRAARGDAIVVTMADLSDDHACIDKMYALFRQGNDVVVASRYARGGAQNGGPVVKGFLSRMAGASLRVLSGLPTWDPTNNFKLYSRALAQDVRIESAGGFEVALELTVKAYQRGLSIAEIPTVWTGRVAGKSNFKLTKWLPKYLRWYFSAIRYRVLRPP